MIMTMIKMIKRTSAETDTPNWIRLY